MIVGTVLGTTLAFALVRARSRIAPTSNVLMLIPLVTPEIVAGVSALLLFTQIGHAAVAATIMIAEITFSISFVTVIVRARLSALNREVEEAALDLGATRLQTLRLVDAARAVAGDHRLGAADLRAHLRRLRDCRSSPPASRRAAAGADLLVDPLRRQADDQRDRDVDARDLVRSLPWRSRCRACWGAMGRERADGAGRMTATLTSEETRRSPMSSPAGAIRFEGITKRFGVDGRGRRPQPERPSTASSSRCSARPGAARPRRCAWSPASSSRPRGASCLDGEPVENVPPYKRTVNTVFQSYALFEHLTCAATSPSGSSAARRPSRRSQRRVGEALELVQLAGRAHAKPRELSGGQHAARRARTRARQPPAVLLLDEPLGALDLKLRKQMQVELKEIQREVGITFLYVTHDQEEALAMSDRIAVMDAGVIEQCGPPEDIYERPEKTSSPASSASPTCSGHRRERRGAPVHRPLVPADVPRDCAAGAKVHSRCAPRRSGWTSSRRGWSRSTAAARDDLPRHDHPVRDRPRRRRAGPGAGAERRPRARRGALDARHAGPARLAPRPLPGAPVTATGFADLPWTVVR